MAYDILSRLSASTVESTVALIKHLIDRVKHRKTNHVYAELISHYLFEKEKFAYLSTYSLIGPTYSLGCLIGHFLFHYITEEDSQKQLGLLAGLLHFVEGFQPSPNALLKKTTTVTLLNMLDQFGMPTAFLKTSYNQPLRIYLVPYKRSDVNGAYYPHVNSIASYRPKLRDLHPEYVFVHEIGHLLCYNLTGDPHRVPPSFLAFNNKHNPTWTGDSVEVFVDLFSMAAMMDTPFASKNPLLTTTSIGTQKTIQDYFTELLKNATYHPIKQPPFSSSL